MAIARGGENDQWQQWRITKAKIINGEISAENDVAAMKMKSAGVWRNSISTSENENKRRKSAESRHHRK